MTDAPGRPSRVVVTGGSGGIGGAIIGRFLSEGATVANLDARPTPRLPASHTIHADVADPAAVLSAFEAVDGLFGGEPPDVFVACAAVSHAAHFLDVSPAEFERCFAVNVRGAFFTTQAAARRMRRVRQGSIVLISSVAAEQGWAQESVYSATKAATRSLVQGMAVELAPFNIRVNAVGPGPIEHRAAGMAATRADPEVHRHEIERTPLHRFGTPDEVADAVALVARMPWATGQTLYVDGGFLAAGLGYFGAARAALAARDWA